MGKASILLSILIDAMRIGLAVYSLHIKNMHNVVQDFKAQCDVSDYVSCSKTLTSKYGTGFGLIGPLLGEGHPLNQPNGIYAIAFFSLHLLLVCFAAGTTGKRLRVLNSLIMSVGCGWLAYILFFVLKHVCLVCIPMYALNFVTLIIDVCVLRSSAVKKAAVRAERKKK